MEEVLDWIGVVTGLTPLSLLITGLKEFTMTTGSTNTARIVHTMRGRVRLRIRGRRHDSVYFQDVQQRLTQCPSVHRVEINPNTASILIYYDNDLQNLLAEAMIAGLAEVIELNTAPAEPINQRLISRLGLMDRRISAATSGEVDGSTLIVMILLMASTVQIVRGQMFGPAVPLLWYSAQAISGMLPFRTAS